jgi:hypothetical protein
MTGHRRRAAQPCHNSFSVCKLSEQCRQIKHQQCIHVHSHLPKIPPSSISSPLFSLTQTTTQLCALILKLTIEYSPYTRRYPLVSPLIHTVVRHHMHFEKSIHTLLTSSATFNTISSALRSNDFRNVSKFVSCWHDMLWMMKSVPETAMEGSVMSTICLGSGSSGARRAAGCVSD